jgi:5-methylcytosine-specific restriction endonuclease McrA
METTAKFKPCLICGILFTAKPCRLDSRKVCSSICARVYQRGENNPNWRGGLVEVACRRCGKAKKVCPSIKEFVHYCSRVCLAFDQSEKFRGEKSCNWKGGDKPRGTRGGWGVSRFHIARICKGCGKTGVSKGRVYHPGCSPRLVKKNKLVRCAGCGVERRLNERKGVYQKRCQSCANQVKGGAGNANWKGGITPANKKIRASEEYKQWREAVFRRDRFTCVWCGQKGGALHADHIKPFANYPKLRLTVSNGRTLCVECHKKTPTYLGGTRRRTAKRR